MKVRAKHWQKKTKMVTFGILVRFCLTSSESFLLRKMTARPRAWETIEILSCFGLASNLRLSSRSWIDFTFDWFIVNISKTLTDSAPIVIIDSRMCSKLTFKPDSICINSTRWTSNSFCCMPGSFRASKIKATSNLDLQTLSFNWLLLAATF